MIRFTQGNLLEAPVDALVNTVNTVGVMGKGIALMFKESFPENYHAYELACKKKEVEVGKVFVTERQDWAGGPRWIVNFPTKQHWRNNSRIEWIEAGLSDLKSFIAKNRVQSIALPPLGSGNGGLNWLAVRPLIEAAFAEMLDVDVIVYEPTATYQNVAKASGVEKLTPARALVAELVRIYSVLGFECTLLEIQKLAYLLERKIGSSNISNPLRLEFKADRFGPYAPKLGHLLNGLDGSYLHCEKRVADAGPLDLIWFEESQEDRLRVYLNSEAKEYLGALNATAATIEGFESPVGMELLATVDWLMLHGVGASIEAIGVGIGGWLGGGLAARRKLKLFDEHLIALALARLVPTLEAQAG